MAHEERDEHRGRAAEDELRDEAVAVEEEDAGHERGRRAEPDDEAPLHRYGRPAAWRRSLAIVTVTVPVVAAPVESVAVTVAVYVPGS